jgi:hypothetical protein
MKVIAQQGHKTRRQRLALTLAMTVVFWALAALLVFEADRITTGFSATGVALIKGAVIAAIAWAFIRIVAPWATVNDAALVGLAWFAMGVAAEISMAATLGRGWFVLLGAPTSAVARAVLLMAWAGAPALFARHALDGDQS